MQNTYSKITVRSRISIYVSILIALFTFQILISNLVLYAQAGNDFVLGCFITLRGEITCSDTGAAPSHTKISVFNANDTTALVKEMIVQDGTYELNLDPGVYCIHFESDGYTTYVSNGITISRESVFVEDVILQKETSSVSSIASKSLYASRKEIFQWIVNDGENYAYNFSFESPDIIAYRDYGSLDYNVYDTSFNIVETQKLYTWVLYDRNSSFATNTFDIFDDNSGHGAYFTMHSGVKYSGFSYYSAIEKTAQLNWRNTYGCQAADGRTANWGGDVYSLTKISAPVFENVDDAMEFIGIVNNYIKNPNAVSLTELEDYMINNTKMLNPLSGTTILYNSLPDNVYFENGRFNNNLAYNNTDFENKSISVGDFNKFNNGGAATTYNIVKDEIGNGKIFEFLGSNAGEYVLNEGKITCDITNPSGKFSDDYGLLWLPVHLPANTYSKMCISVATKVA